MSDEPQHQGDEADTVIVDERRVHQRVPASLLKGYRAQLPTGPEVILKDLSRSGARFQSESRMLPGLSVGLKVVTPDGDVTIRGKVVRSRLVRLDKGGMGYEAAVAFTDLLPVFAEEHIPAQSAAPAPSPAASPTEDLQPAASAPGVPSLPEVAEFDAEAFEPPSPDQPEADGDEIDDDVPMMMLVTAAVPQSMAEIREMFNGNDW